MRPDPGGLQIHLRGGPDAFAPGPPLPINRSPLAPWTMELSAIPTIEPRAAGHQEQGQEKLPDQRQRRHGR